jgi:hypothetical protein
LPELIAFLLVHEHNALVKRFMQFSLAIYAFANLSSALIALKPAFLSFLEDSRHCLIT